MSKPVKDLMTREYEERYGELNGACVVSVIGLDAVSSNLLRRELRTRQLRLQVVKNSLARRAFADSAMAPLGAVLSGPCALVTGGESVIDVAKALVDLKKTYAKLDLKVGMLEGDPELVTVEKLAQMKNRGQTLSEVAMLIRSPGGRLAGCLLSPGGRIAGCVKAVIEKAESGSEGAEPSAN